MSWRTVWTAAALLSAVGSDRKVWDAITGQEIFTSRGTQLLGSGPDIQPGRPPSCLRW